MSASPRSSVLSKGEATGATYQDILIVPPGITVIVKSVNAYVGTTTQVVVNVFVYTAGQPWTISIVRGSFDNTAPIVASGWLVMQAGDRLLLQTSGGPVQWWISGTILQGVQSIIGAVQAPALPLPPPPPL